MYGIGLLQPDACEVQLAHGIGQAHQRVQLHQNEVLGRPEVQIRPCRQSVWLSLCVVVVISISTKSSVEPKHTQAFWIDF